MPTLAAPLASAKAWPVSLRPWGGPAGRRTFTSSCLSSRPLIPCTSPGDRPPFPTLAPTSSRCPRPRRYFFCFPVNFSITNATYYIALSKATMGLTCDKAVSPVKGSEAAKRTMHPCSCSLMTTMPRGERISKPVSIN